MKNLEKSTSEQILYTNKEFRIIVKIYQQILNILLREVPSVREDLNINGSYNIMNIQRGLKDGSKQIFWDYLSATHGNMEEIFNDQFDKNSTFRCIKITFYSGESVTLINNPKTKVNEETGKTEIAELPDGVLCLDDYRKRLDNKKTHELDELLTGLNILEKGHFSSKDYRDRIGNVLNNKGDNTPDNIRNRLALVLNLQYE